MSLQTDFLSAINQVAAERNLDPQDIIEAIKEAIATGFRKNYPEYEESLINVEVGADTGEVTVFMDKKVVEKVSSKATQISLKEAQKLEKKLRVGDHVEIDVTPQADFGRVAAQAAKQVILQKLRETEKEIQVKRFVDHIGEIETGIVQRVEGNTVLWEIGRAIALMPEEERIMSEFYRTGSRHKVLLKEISQTPKGKTIIVSRASSEFLKALFELEIPELQSGTVEIKGVAREAGMRSKVAVVSNVDGIDPIGSCVGQRGMRIMAIMGELKVGSSEEKVDIILWDDDPEQFVVNALSPAQVVSTKITDKERKIIEVIVPDEQLSLAIGRDGQNVRLAAKLTGWNIDIQGETIKVGTDQRKENEEKADKNKKKENKKETIDWISELKLNSRLAGIIEKSGINSLDDLKEKIENGEKIAGVGPKSVEEIQKALK